MAGNGTIGLEILEDLPDVDAVLVPCGGGGLTCGIASALPGASPARGSIAVEPETGAPLAASLARRRAARRRLPRRRSSTARAAARCCRRCGRWRRSWSTARVAVSLDETAAAVRLLAERARVVAEGAGALALAAALAGPGRHRQGRLHRLGRQHRRLAPGRDPAGATRRTEP